MRLIEGPEDNVASYSTFAGPGRANDAVRSCKHEVLLEQGK